MAFTTARLNSALDAALNGAAWAQIHDGDPGAAGTNNILPEQSAPVATTFPGASSATTQEIVEFTITGSTGVDSVTHVSLWTDSGGSPGTFIASGVLTPQETFAGAGTLEVTIDATAANA